MYTGKKVLVTGGTGLVGTQVVDLLLARGATVRVASLDDPSLVNPHVEFVRGDLMGWEFCRKAVKGMDFVFHLAGIKGSVGIGSSKAASFLVPHLLINTHMMEAARQEGVDRYLFTSSIAVYPPAERFQEDRVWQGQPHPTDRYGGWAKRMGELQAEAYQLEYGWDRIAIVRPANIYGPYDNFDPKTAMVVPALIRRVLDGENPLHVWGDGGAVRDFIFARDVAAGMLLALEKAANCTPVNLGSGTGCSIKGLVEIIASLVDHPPDIVWDKRQAAGEAVRVLDMTRAETLLGFKAQTSLRDGLRETLAWFQANRHKTDARYNVFYKKSVVG